MKDKFKEYLMIFIGVILVALALEYFFIPNEIAAGGVTGLAVVITQYIPVISTGTLVFIMNIVLFVVGFVFLGKGFGLKTIVSSLLLSGIMIFIEQFFKPFALTNDLMLATIFGAAITAFGMGIIFNVNASTGGTDIIAKVLNKYFNIDVGKSLLVVDFIITLLGAVTFGLDKGFYAILSVVMNGILIDKVIEGFNKCKEVVIISAENKKISRFILEDLDRGCTYLKGIGAFSGEETRVIYAVLGRSEFIRLKQYISKIDPQAFITVGEVHEVMGEGFGDLG